MNNNKNNIEKLQEFLRVLQSTIQKIDSGRCSLDDYLKLEDYFKMIGLPELIISDIYLDCGFGSWKELHIERRKPANDRNNKGIKCSLGKINGVYNGIKSQIEAFITTQSVNSTY